MAKLFGLTCITLTFLCFAVADVSHLPIVQQQQEALLKNQINPAPVTEACLGCMCEAMSECKQGTQCEGDVCGLFRMTWSYWADSGKPTLNGEAPTSPTAYANCANDPYCAATAVQGYMGRFGKDCNGDGAIDCRDFMSIHYLGGWGSCNGQLPPLQSGRFEQLKSKENHGPVSDICLACMCEAMTECNHEINCEGAYCGIFKISITYWTDASKPTVDGEQSTSDISDFENCATDAYCAGKAVQGYMAKFAKDINCNGSSEADCRDYMRLHYNGGRSACNASLPQPQKKRFENCIKQLAF
uniref:lysozyme n=2 Tax=Culicoides sonorensis TaxID=179676 RepID=A0A336LXM4_CULSO